MDQKPFLQHFYKQPSEKFYITANFSDVWTTGEAFTIGSCSVSAKDKNGADASDDVLEVGTLAVNGTSNLIVRVKEGTESLDPYKITFVAVTDLGNIFEVDVELRIEDI